MWQFSVTLEEAEAKIDYYLDMSSVDSDDEKNRQKLKKTRWMRAKKIQSGNSESEEESKEKGKLTLKFNSSIPVQTLKNNIGKPPITIKGTTALSTCLGKVNFMLI